MPKPSVSVVIPTFNRIDLVREALDSVAAQGFRDFEVLLIDDGSDPPIPSSIEAHPARPRLLRQDRNKGPAAARNLGVAQAQADTIAFLDSDDLWTPTKLERFMAALDRSDRRILYGPMLPIDARRQPVTGRTKPCHDGRITQHLFCSSFVHVPTVVCRRELFVAAGGFDEDLPVCEDYDLWLRISVDEPFGLLDEPLALRRLHDSRLSKEHMCRNLLVKARMLERFYQAHGYCLDRAVAEARLAKTHFAAARAALRDRRFAEAAACAESGRRYGGSWWRGVPVRLAARAGTCVARSDGREAVGDGARSVTLSGSASANRT